MTKSGPKRRYGALATGHAVIMSSCDLTTSQLKPLMQTLQRRGRGAPAVTVCGGAKLLAVMRRGGGAKPAAVAMIAKKKHAL